MASTMSTNRDQLYQTANAKPGSFRFDEKVARIFADMIARSVPGYEQILSMLPTLTRQFAKEHACYYDLGCSLGAGLLAISQGLKTPNAKLLGVDNSDAMLTQARENLAGVEQSVELIKQDIVELEYSNAAMILMNFTLQFIPLEARDNLIEKLYHGLNPGGALILSEKIRFDDARTQQIFTDIHHQFKADQGYSELEISRKRDAIDQVLIPETLTTHIQRLQDAGFSIASPWIQNLQFVSILAIK